MHRYGGLTDFLALPALTGARLLRRAADQEQDERLHREWCAVLPFMQVGLLKLMQFSEYRERRLGLNIDFRPSGEILAELEERFGRSLV